MQRSIITAGLVLVSALLLAGCDEGPGSSVSYAPELSATEPAPEPESEPEPERPNELEPQQPDPPGSSASATDRLLITTVPSGASIKLDGAVVGGSGSSRSGLAAATEALRTPATLDQCGGENCCVEEAWLHKSSALRRESREYQVTLTWTDDDGDDAVLEFTISVVGVGAGIKGRRT